MPAAAAAAEEILQAIYGDDLEGCAIRPEAIVTIIAVAMRESSATQAEMLELYEKAIEALKLLSTPPAEVAGLAPANIPPLLSERLDTIHQLTTKLMMTAAAARAQVFNVDPAP